MSKWTPLILAFEFAVCFLSSWYGEQSAHRSLVRRGLSRPRPTYDRLFFPVIGFLILCVVAFTVDDFVNRLFFVAVVFGGIAGDAWSMRRRRRAQARAAEKQDA